MAIDYIHAPPNERALDELFVFVSLDEGGRGICAGMIPNIGATLLVTGSPKVAEIYKGLAAEVARLSGKRVAMVRYSRGEELWSSDT